MSEKICRTQNSYSGYIYLMCRVFAHRIFILKRKTAHYIVYSKWSCAFLDLRSSECTCARKSTCFASRIIQYDYNFPAITPFSVGCSSGGTCRTNKIKTSVYGFNMLLWSIITVELTNSSAAQNHVGTSANK